MKIYRNALLLVLVSTGLFRPMIGVARDGDQEINVLSHVYVCNEDTQQMIRQKKSVEKTCPVLRIIQIPTKFSHSLSKKAQELTVRQFKIQKCEAKEAGHTGARNNASPDSIHGSCKDVANGAVFSERELGRLRNTFTKCSLILLNSARSQTCGALNNLFGANPQRRKLPSYGKGNIETMTTDLEKELETEIETEIEKELKPNKESDTFEGSDG